MPETRFETRIVPEKDGRDQGYVPQWVIDYYYSKHPELKSPSGAIKPAPPSLVDAPEPVAKPTPPPKPVAPPPEVLSQPNP